MDLRITKNVSEANLITHDGKFHPDDVFSTMFLAKFFENSVVCRVSVNSDLKTDAIVYDVGFGKFDHHGECARYRDNSNIKYCSFGLLWEEYGNEYLKRLGVSDVDKLYKRIENKLILQIDGIDNGLFYKIDSPYSILDLDKIIDMYNLNWDEEDDVDEYFLKAVKMAEVVFDNVLRREISSLKAISLVEEQIENVEGNILVLDRFLPYSEAIFCSDNVKAKEIKVVILPSNRGGYAIKPLTVSFDSKELVCIFPKRFRGLHGSELVEASGVLSATFVHSSGFMACAMELSDALKLAEMAIENGIKEM